MGENKNKRLDYLQFILNSQFLLVILDILTQINATIMMSSLETNILWMNSRGLKIQCSYSWYETLGHIDNNVGHVLITVLPQIES